MKTNCDIIRDLLPLYAEHITSEATNALVEESIWPNVKSAAPSWNRWSSRCRYGRKRSRMRPCAGSGLPCKEGASVQRSALCWQPCALWQ